MKGKPGEPLSEETTLGLVVHGGGKYGSGSTCMYLREVSDYEKLFNLKVEDRGENDQLNVVCDFKESVARREDGRYKVSFPWIPRATLPNTYETLCRKRLENVERKLSRVEKLKAEYNCIIEERLRAEIIEEMPRNHLGKYSTCYINQF